MSHRPLEALAPVNNQAKMKLPLTFLSSALLLSSNVTAFQVKISRSQLTTIEHFHSTALREQKEDNAVVELGGDEEEIVTSAAPFLSQSNEIDPQALNPDLSDPKQARVIIYILISLIPVLFLIPLMIGSRDLIPLDALPPVDV